MGYRVKPQTPLIALVLAVIVGGCALWGGAWIVFVESRGDEQGNQYPINLYSVVWIAMAIVIMGAVMALLQRKVQKRRRKDAE